MEKIIQILMRRDGMSRDEAKELIRDVKEMMTECNYDPIECENIVAEELGLEPDYIIYLL